MAELTIISPSANPYVLDTQGDGYIAGESVPIRVRYPVQFRNLVSISMDISYSDPDFPATTPIWSRSFSDMENTVNEYSTAWKANYGSSPRSASLHFTPVWTGTGANPFDENGVTQEIYQSGLTSVVPTGSVSASPSEVSVASQSGFSTVYVTYVSASSGGYDIKSPSLSTGLEGFIVLGSSSVGESKIVTYSLSYPANTSTSPVTHSATFAMSRSGDIKTDTTYIYQAAASSPSLPVGSVVIPDSPYTVGANTRSQQVVVIYSESVDRYTIQTPSYGGGVTSVSFVNSQSVGNNKIVTWSVSFPANPTVEPITRWATFSMQSGSDDPISRQAYIFQQGRGGIVGSVNIGPYNPLNVNAGTTSSTFFVTYSNANPGEYDVKDPITSSGILSITKSLQSRDSDVYGIYSIKYLANTSTANSVTHSIMFVMSSSNDIQRSTGYVYQAKDTSSYSIHVSGSPVTTPGYASSVNFKVTYLNSLGWTIDTAGTSKPDMQVTSGSIVVSGSNKIVNYTITFGRNTSGTTMDRAVFFQMHSGSQYAYKTGWIYQLPYVPPVVGTITVDPVYTWVDYFNTESTIRVDYTYNGIDYNRHGPTGSSGVTVTLVSESAHEDGVTSIFRATYPANNTSSPVTRSVNFRMTSGNLVSLQAAYIYQDIQGGGGSKQILVNPTSNWINYDETSTTAQVTYLGFSSLSEIDIPTSNDSNWQASVGNVQESSGQVVVTWVFTGTPNASSNYKSTVFTIFASGATSKTFTVFQWGKPGGGGTATESTAPIWQQKTITANAASTKLTVTSGSKVIFDEKVYARPDLTRVEVDLSKICSPFVTNPSPANLEPEEGRGYYNYYYLAGSVSTLVSQTFPSFLAEFETGESYRVYFYNDRSYDLVQADWDDVSKLESLHVGPKVQDRILPNQLVFFGVRNLSSTTSRTVRIYSGRNYTYSTILPRSFAIKALRLYDCSSRPSQAFMVGSGDNPSSWSTVYKSIEGKIQGKWAVYYWNSLGGLDSLPLCGPVVPSIDVTRNNYFQGVYNYTRSYLNGVVSRWRCNTGTLPDGYAAMIRELVASPKVYLHDLETNKIYSTRVATNSIEEKTFWNQGRKFADYEFSLESILTQERR